MRLDAQCAEHGLAKVVGQRQAQPGAAVLAGDCGFGLGERLEYFCLSILRDADTGVAHLDAYTMFPAGRILMVGQAHIDTPETGELERVGQQVADDLPDPGRVAGDHRRKIRRNQAGQFHAGRCILREQIGGVLDQPPKVERNALDLQMAGIELGHVENIVEQFDQHLARVVGDHQLLALLGTERAVQRERQHAQQTVEWRADFMTHVRQKRRACVGHVQCRAARDLQFFVGLAQAHVAGLELVGTCRNNIFQLVQMVGQPILGGAAPGKFATHGFELAIERRDQHADFVLLVIRRAGDFRLIDSAWVAAAQVADDPHQRLGQGRVEQNGQNAGQRQAADKTIEQGDLGALQKVAAEREGVYGQVQCADGFVWHVVEVQLLLKLPAFAKQPVTEHPVTPGGSRSFDAGQHRVVVIGQSGTDHGRGVQQPEREFLGEFGVDVVSDTRSRVLDDFQQ